MDKTALTKIQMISAGASSILGSLLRVANDSGHPLGDISDEELKSLREIAIIQAEKVYEETTFRVIKKMSEKVAAAEATVAG